MVKRPSGGLALTLCAGLVGAGLGGPVWAETLADAVAVAYSSNPTLLAQRASVRALNESFVQARAAYGPNAQASATFSEQSIQGIAVGGSQSGPANTLSLQLDQPLYTGGRAHARVSAAEADVLSGRETLRRAEISVLQQVATTYAAVRRDQRVFEVLSDTLAALQRQNLEVVARFKVEEVTRTDVAQAEARLNGQRARVLQARGRLEVTRSQYAAVVGQAPGSLAPEPALPEGPRTTSEAMEVAARLNPQIRAAEFTQSASAARIAEARAANRPTVSLRLSADRSPAQRYTPALGDLDAVTATAVVSQPLYTAGLNASRVRQARELNDRDRANADATRRAVYQSVAQALDQLAVARQNLELDRTIVDAQNRALTGVRLEHPYGLRSTIEVLNAEQEANDAEIDAVQHRYDQFASNVALMAATGVLTPALFNPAVQTYSPEEAFDRVKNKGRLPWETVVEALDKVGAPSVRAPPSRAEPIGSAAVPSTLIDERRPTPDPGPPAAEPVGAPPR